MISPSLESHPHQEEVSTKQSGGEEAQERCHRKLILKKRHYKCVSSDLDDDDGHEDFKELCKHA